MKVKELSLCHSLYMELRGQLCGAGIYPTLYRFRGLDSSCQAYAPSAFTLTILPVQSHSEYEGILGSSNAPSQKQTKNKGIVLMDVRWTRTN